MSFLADLYEETARRRRRLAGLLGPRLAGVVETLLFGGAWLGLAGWALRPWGMQVAPWAILIPLVSLGIFLLLELRRQQAARLLPPPPDPLSAADREALEEVAGRHDLRVHGLSALFAVAGFATFLWILAREPAPPTVPPAPEAAEDGGWTPPENAPGGDLIQ
jgi:hypothetical protein